MRSHVGGSRMWRVLAAVLLFALMSAVLAVLLASNARFASAQALPDPIARSWGINSFGQIGDDSIAPRSKQVEVKGEGGVGALGGVTSLEGGQNHTVALKNGTAYAWGHNGSGQLANGGGPDSNTPVQVKGENAVGTLTGATDITAGGEHSLAIKDGNVYAWGLNNFGQLGDDTSVFQRNAPVKVVEGEGGFSTPF